MARVVYGTRRAATDPVKHSQPLGGAMAFLGVSRCMPLLHGPQGCSAFAKALLTRHFREPIPLQTSALTEVTTVLGAGESLRSAIATITERHHPDVIGVLTTGVVEISGEDVAGTLSALHQGAGCGGTCGCGCGDGGKGCGGGCGSGTADGAGCGGDGRAERGGSGEGGRAERGGCGEGGRAERGGCGEGGRAERGGCGEGGRAERGGCGGNDRAGGAGVGRAEAEAGGSGADPLVLAASTPDFEGGLSEGWAAALAALLSVPGSASPEALDERLVAVPVGVSLTAADLDELADLVRCFGLAPLLVPDLSRSLDGHLAPGWTPLTTGGTTVDELRRMPGAGTVLAVGTTAVDAATGLAARIGARLSTHHHFSGLAAMDALVTDLAQVSGRAAPERLRHARRRLADGMLDCHFVLGGARVALAGEPEQVASVAAVLTEAGAEIVTAVVPTASAVLDALPCEEVIVGDLADLEEGAAAAEAELVVASSHARALARRLDIPHLAAGFPVYDRLGAQHNGAGGYRGGLRLLFEAANLLLDHRESGHHGSRGRGPGYQAPGQLAPGHHDSRGPGDYLDGQRAQGRPGPESGTGSSGRSCVERPDHGTTGMGDAMLKVAFATGDGEAVDRHFGRCERFDVYQLSARGATLLESRVPAPGSRTAPGGASGVGAGLRPGTGSDGPIDTRIALLRDCAILHVVSIGGAAAARVVNARIHPLKVAEGTSVADLNTRLVAVLAGNPPPWLRKALGEGDRHIPCRAGADGGR